MSLGDIVTRLVQQPGMGFFINRQQFSVLIKADVIFPQADIAAQDLKFDVFAPEFAHFGEINGKFIFVRVAFDHLNRIRINSFIKDCRGDGLYLGDSLQQHFSTS